MYLLKRKSIESPSGDFRLGQNSRVDAKLEYAYIFLIISYNRNRCARRPVIITSYQSYRWLLSPIVKTILARKVDRVCGRRRVDDLDAIFYAVCCAVSRLRIRQGPQERRLIGGTRRKGLGRESDSTCVVLNV